MIQSVAVKTDDKCPKCQSLFITTLDNPDNDKIKHTCQNCHTVWHSERN